MSDYLVKRLRKMSPSLDILECEDVLQAADRIEQMDAAFTNLSREYEKRGNRIEELEAKLAKAVEVLTEIKDIARASQGPAAQFYGMLANKALTKLGETDGC